MGKSCAPIEKVYKSAKNDKSVEGWSTYKKKSDESEQSSSNNLCVDDEDECLTKTEKPKEKKSVVKEALLSPKLKDALNGAVYHPAKPYQIWLAPFKDKHGILYSGNYVWITTPAYWTYAGVKVPSANAQWKESEKLAPAYIQNYTPPSNPLQQAADALNNKQVRK
ncbi:hypothetical protein JCM17795_16390 [Galenea microaerophila]